MSTEEIFTVGKYGYIDYLSYGDYKGYINDDLKKKMEDLMDDGYCFDLCIGFEDEDDAMSSVTAIITCASEDGARSIETTKEEFADDINDYAEDMVRKATKDRESLLKWMIDAIDETELGDITVLEICNGYSYYSDFLSNDDVNSLFVNHQDYLEEKTGKKIERNYYDYYGCHIGVAVWSVAE